MIRDSGVISLLGVALDHLHGFKREPVVCQGRDKPEVSVGERTRPGETGA
jgi:hypothetical protein